MNKLSAAYWDERYKLKQTGWDAGAISVPLKEYFDQLTNKEVKILVPGAGKGHEVEYLFNNGFKNTYLLDFSIQSILAFKERYPEFPDNQILNEDFFRHKGQYDLIVEQTFFSSFPRSFRENYAKCCYNLLKHGGRLVGLLFSHEFDFDGPPFGGTATEYKKIFRPYFDLEIFESANNSIKPRKDRELFIKLRKKQS